MPKKSTTPTTPVDRLPDPGCACYDPAAGVPCFCGPAERRLRAMNDSTRLEEDQIQWCLAEIRRVEGWGDYEFDGNPKSLGRDVLNAWLDYCRDKGLL